MVMKTTVLGMILAAMSLGAHADSKRYLVKFKNNQTFQSVMQSVRAAQFSSPNAMFTTNTGGAVRLLNTNAAITTSLDQIQMLVIESNDEAAVRSLKQHPAIGLVEEEIIHPAPKPLATRGAAVVLGKKKAGKMALPWGIKAVNAPAAWQSTKGAGARVMVLDTGLDTAHPAVKSRFEAGQNFTTFDVNDITDEVGHGTHVAGTILADGLNGGLVGVAPEAKLLSGKVCSARGCSSIAIARGVNWAVQQKVDVVNMSLGGVMMSEAEAQALVAAEAAGVMIVAASGNDGTARVGYPAAFRTALAVGAIDEHLKKADFSQYGPELGIVGPGVDVISSVPLGTGRAATVNADLGKGLTEINATPFVGSPLVQNAANEVVFAGLGQAADFTGVNVSGKFALISRGTITFEEKVANAIAAGAAGVIVFNNAPGLMQGTLTEDGSEVAIPVAMIEQGVGETAKQLLAQGQVVRFSMSIDATDFASFQGTSMATPHVAGVAALVRAANRNLTPAEVRALLKATATPLSPNANNELGSGLVNAREAVAQAFTGALVAPQMAQAAN
ncbi:MAG: S8 family serine peptidase [Pseudobdellovibrionaceae bacterium]